MTILDPDAPEFREIKVDLARIFIDHRADLGLPAGWDDALIVACVGDIAYLLIGTDVDAAKRGDERLPLRFSRPCILQPISEVAALRACW